MFFSTLRKKVIGARTREIPLNALARLWAEKEMAKTSSSDTPRPCAWRNEDIHRFYVRYLMPNLSAIGPAVPVIIHLLNLLDDAGERFAPTDIFDETKGFSTVTLRTRSLAVARIAVDMTRKSHRDYENMLGKLLIICLGHGIGVLSSTKTIGGVVARTLMMIDPLIQNLSYKQDIVTAILTACETNPRNDEAWILKASIRAAQQQEMEQANVLSEFRLPDLPDMQQIRAAIHTTQEKQS